MPPARLIIWPFLATLGIASSAHADAVADLADALVHDSEITLHFRSHYLDRDKSAAADSLAWAGDTLRLGLTAYASQKLYGPADQDGAALLLAGQKSYAVLGEVIDMSFVRDMTTNSGNASIVKAIIALGHSLGLEVIAEGVEEPEQASYLRSLQCDVIQGYLISRPMPADEMTHFLESFQPLAAIGS